jgi:CubicO group peptidase (beta-lactamase class C family)
MHARTCLVILVTGALAAELGAQGPLPDSVRSRVDRVFARFDRTDSPGCALGIGNGGHVVYERGYGMSDLQHHLAITPASIFHVASISKQFAAAAVGVLAAEGRLSLDDDVRRYVPEVPDHGHRITIRQLIHHTSGLRDQWSLLAAAGWRSDDLIIEQDVLDIIARQRRLNFVPGAEYVYSNTGYTLLAVIVKRVSGLSLREFAHQRWFVPLGMTRTHFHDDHTMIVHDRTSAYQPRAGGNWSISIPVFDTYGATSLFTTPRDLLRWMAELDRPTVLSPGLVREMETSAVLTDGTATGYGFGLAVDRHRGLRTVGHSGADAGYRSFAVRIPERGLAVAILCNASTANTGELARGVLDALLGTSAPAGTATIDTTPGTMSAMARALWPGTYRDSVTRLMLRIEVRGDSLRLTGGPVLRPASDTSVFVPGGGQAYTLHRRDGRVIGISVAPSGTRQAWFRREPPFTPNRSALASYAGRYVSEELETTYEVALTDTGLVLRRRRFADAPLQPAVPDAFSSRGGVIEFTRGADGRPNGFTLTNGRMRYVRFVRAAP